MWLSYSVFFAVSAQVARCAEPSLCPWEPSTPCRIQQASQPEDLHHLVRSALQQPLREEAPPSSKWEEVGKCVEAWCIFVNRGFASGRGMVAITTRPNFEKLVQIDEDATKLRPQSPPPFYIDKVSGKGLGVVANRSLHRGDLLMTEFPALLVHRGVERSSISQSKQHSLLDAALDALPQARRDEFLAQMGHFGGHRITDILTTNAFQLDLGGSDGFHYGSFPPVSRFNHDCRPNVAFYINDQLQHVTTVVRDVAPGEELSITYLDSATPRNERQSRARNAWGFECGCSQCKLSDGASALSDARIAEMKQIEKIISDPTSTEVTPGLLRKLVKLYRDDRLDTELGGAYTLIALNYNMLGEAAAAVKYAKLAEEAVIIEGGENVGDVAAMRELAVAPKEHFTWRRRLPG